MGEPKYQTPDLTLIGADHIRRYRETDGDVGFLWNGVPTLLLTTTGRRSGDPHTSALIFARNGGDHLVVASFGGASRHPAWYLNLQANPNSEIQVKSEILAVTARTATAAEKPRLWALLTELWPNFDVYQTRTEREIPVVVLSP